MAYIGVKPTIGNFQICDAISVVNGQAAYTMQVGSVNVSPQSANHMIVSLNGVIQKPGSSYTVSGNTITFASNLATGDVIDFIQILGDVLDLGVPSDATVTAAKLNNDIISGQTALAATPADTDEFLISDAGTIKRIDYSYIKGGDNTPAWQVFAANSPTGLAFNANNTVPLDTVGFDTDSGHNTTTYKYTVPEAGKYQLNFQYAVESVSGGNIITVLAEIYNETTSKILLRRRTVSGGDHSSTNQPLVDSISGIKSLAANDVIYCRVYVYSSSGSLKINGSSDQEWSQFSGCKILGA